MITVRRAVKWLVLAAVVAVPSPAHAAGVDLSTYERIGRYDLPEPKRTVAPANSLLAQEASAVTYDWDTDSLFVVGDGGTSVVQVSKTGQLIDSMTLAQGTSPQGTAFYDTEGIAYVGGGKFVLSEERDRQVNLFTYVPNTTLDRADVQTVKLGTTVGNIGIEGLSYDPQTSGFVVVKESGPEGIFQTGIDFVAHTATNGSPTTVNSTDLFDPALAGLADFSDVFALSNVPAFAGPDASHLLILSQEAGKIVNVDRAGTVSSTLTIAGDADNPQPVPEQSHEGLAMDPSGKLYVVSETGGGDIDHPQLWVYAPSATPAPPNLIVSEVSPWSSGNSPYAADWFEVTNKGTQAVDLTGWKVDDSSNAYATAVALNGISSIAPGQSVIFIEGNLGDRRGVQDRVVRRQRPRGLRDRHLQRRRHRSEHRRRRRQPVRRRREAHHGRDLRSVDGLLHLRQRRRPRRGLHPQRGRGQRCLRRRPGDGLPRGGQRCAAAGAGHRDGERHGPRSALARPRRRRLVRPVHRGPHEGLPGRDDGDGDVDRR